MNELNANKPPLVSLKEVSVQLVAMLEELELLETQILTAGADGPTLDLALVNARKRFVSLQAEHRETADRVVDELRKKLEQ